MTAATHTDKHGHGVRFYEASDGSPVPFYVTPCCGAAVSIFTDDGTVYCKSCYGEADMLLCGVPTEPFKPIKEMV